MNSPVIWILLPASVGSILLLFRRNTRLTGLLSGNLCFVLAFLAFLLPLNQEIQLLRFTFVISDKFVVLGRQFIISSEDQILIAILYITCAIWMFGSRSADLGELFVPLGLISFSALIAMLSVTPILYSSLLYVLAVMAIIPVIVEKKPDSNPGTIRFLVFQTLSMPFVLLGTWLISGQDVIPVEAGIISQAFILIGIGLIFMLGVFPTFTWIPMISRSGSPLLSGYTISVFPIFAILFLMRWLNTYAHTLDDRMISITIISMGTIMILVGGIGAGFQRNLGAVLGYFAIAEIGRSILLTLIDDAWNYQLGFILLRVVSISVICLSLQIISSRVRGFRFRDIQGYARYNPVVSSVLLLGLLSVAGFPLSMHFSLMVEISKGMLDQPIYYLVFVMLGSLGLLAAALRTFAVLIMGNEGEFGTYKMDRIQVLQLLTGSIILIVMGVFPEWILLI